MSTGLGDTNAACLAAGARHWLGSVGSLVSEPGDGALTLSAAATGTAAGTSTLARTSVDAVVVVRGLVTFAFGEASAEATARSKPGVTAFATAETAVQADGADFFITATSRATGNGATWWSEASRTSFLAIDIQGLAPSGGPVTEALSSDGTITKQPAIPKGNIATFDTNVLVLAPDSLADVQVEALAIEDRLSTSTIQVVAVGEGPVVPGTPCFLVGTKASERYSTGTGDDWILGGGGHDSLNAGEGHNTAFGEAGNDWLEACTGDDWLFGGIGNDVLLGGDGENLLYGGAGHDTIFGGTGQDRIRDGRGNDVVYAGDGDNTFILGGNRAGADGNDCFFAGSGADWYVLERAFGSDTIHGFRVAEGDRLVLDAGDWDSAESLRQMNGESLFLRRTGDDLIFTFRQGSVTSYLTLDDFFDLNAEYDAILAGRLPDWRAVPLLSAMVVDSDTDAAAADRLFPFAAGDALSLLG
jgi:Ca2+-binding RTX toxin-like protein